MFVLFATIFTYFVGPSGIFSDAPERLKTKIILGRIKHCLKTSYLFNDYANDVLEDVALTATTKAVPADIVMCKHDFKFNCIYLILRGYCELYSYMPGDKEKEQRRILKFGDSFPVVETLHQVLLFVDVKSLTAVQLICINTDVLFGVLKRHPLVHNELMESINEHYKINKLKLLRQRGRLQPLIPSQKSLGHGDMFTYTVFNETDRVNKAFLVPLDGIRKGGILKYLLCLGSINPKKMLFISIEAFQYVCGVMRTITTVLYDNVLFPYIPTIGWVFRVADVIYIISMYIRMHVQYYNEIGILVTHPWLTMKRYFTTTFFIDLWSFIPISFSGFYELIGSDNRIMTGAIFRIISRPLQMHRLFGLLNYFQSNIQSPYLHTIQTIKYTIFTATIVGLIGTLFQYQSIEVTKDKVIK